MFAYLGFGLALLSLVLTSLMILGVRKTLNKYQPLISRAMSIMGTVGKKAQVDEQLAEEVGEAMKGGVLKMITTKYPEVAIVIGYLEEEHPELFDKLMDNPEMIVSLYQRYAPIIKQLIGSAKKSPVQYEL